MKNADYIVLQCYGNEGVFVETAWALLSLSRLYPAVPQHFPQIWLYTDQPEWFSRFTDCPFPLSFRQIDQPTITKWRGAINFVHRMKIEVLRDFCANHEGNVLYLDTDVLFTHPFEAAWQQIEQGSLYMHVMESRVSDEANPVTRKLNAHLKSKSYLSGSPLNEMEMWNAGVLGFNTSRRQLLDDVLAFTDQLYPDFPKHIAEQFAFSVIFGRAGQIKSAAPFLLHYWNLKEGRALFRAFFQHFSGATWADLVRYSSLVQVHVLMQEKMNFYFNRSLAGKIRKELWKPMEVDWNKLTSYV